MSLIGKSFDKSFYVYHHGFISFRVHSDEEENEDRSILLWQLQGTCACTIISNNINTRDVRIERRILASWRETEGARYRMNSVEISELNLNLIQLCRSQRRVADVATPATPKIRFPRPLGNQR